MEMNSGIMKVEHDASWNQIMQDGMLDDFLRAFNEGQLAIIRSLHNIAFENGRRAGLDAGVGMISESFRSMMS
jgi:hypothetical protein